jgi:hypothetical protein
MLGLGNSLTGGFIGGGGPPFSLGLSGTNDYGYIAHHSSVKPTSGITVSSWVNFDAQYGGSGWTFVNNVAGNADRTEYIVGAIAVGGYGLNVFYGGTYANPIVRISAQINVSDTGNGNPGYLTCGWGGVVTSTSSSALHEIKDLSGWVHLAMTYDGGVLRLYINGSNDLNIGAVDTSDGQVTDSGVTGKSIVYSTNTPVMIGGDAIGTGNLSNQLTVNGLIDETAIWSTALDQQAITKIYNNGAATINLTVASGDYDNQASLEGYWRFEEGTGTTVADSSSNSNVLTLVNNPAWSDVALPLG